MGSNAFKKEDVIVLKFDNSVKKKTIQNTIKKYRYTMQHIAYDRTPLELLDNLFMGDFAKNCLVYMLRNDGCILIDYDEIRTDDFLQADPGWDIKVGKYEITIEVKSSLPPIDKSTNKQMSIEALIRHFDIKVIARNDKNTGALIMPLDLASIVHIQIYFYAKTYKKSRFETFEDLYAAIIATPDSWKDVFALINPEKYYEPLFFGWSTKEEVDEHIKTLVDKTWTFEWTKAEYWRCPIIKAHTYAELVNLLKEDYGNADATR